MCSCQRTRPVLFTRGCNPGQVFPANSYVQVALSPVFSIQLRSPPSLGASARHFFPCCEKMVGVNGVEPLTPRLSSACSNQLSYTPVSNVELRMMNAERLKPVLHSSFSILHSKVGGAEEIRTPDL